MQLVELDPTGKVRPVVYDGFDKSGLRAKSIQCGRIHIKDCTKCPIGARSADIVAEGGKLGIGWINLVRRLSGGHLHRAFYAALDEIRIGMIRPLLNAAPRRP